MKLVILFLPFLFIGFLCSAKTVPLEPETAKNVIEKFYKAYLGNNGKNKKSSKNLSFSKSFEDLLSTNRKICHEKAGTDICGWGADGDVYLDAQEIGPNLNYQNSKISITEINPGKVQVKFNVYPSIKDTEGFYDREILFVMTQEKGHWVVDDMLYNAESARKSIEDENSYFLKKTTK